MSSFTVYKHTSPSGKVYIGITSQKPESRWANGKGYKHSPHFRAAIKRHGWGNISHEILAEGLTREAAEQMEVELIKSYHSTDREYGYNIDRGGSTGPKHTEETRAKISEANRCRKWALATREKLRVYRLAHPATEETARKIAEANRGRRHRPESVEKIRAASRKAPVINMSTGQKYPSINSAARDLNLDPSKIVAVCRGKRKTHGGHCWRYAEGVMP